MKEVEEVFHLGTGEVKTADPSGGIGEESGAEDHNRKVEKLENILRALAQLWWIDSTQFDIATEILADRSRDYKWRAPLGKSGVLIFYLEILSCHELRHSLKKHVLRLLGNSCADLDENRELIASSVNYLSSIILQLKDSTVLPYTLPVLFNICVDYASEVEHAPDDTAVALINTASNHESIVDLETYISLVNTALSYLQHKKFQIALLLQEGSLNTIITILVDSYSRFEIQTAESTLNENDDVKALTSMITALNQVLSDISALQEFQEIYPVSSKFCKTLQSWLLPSTKQVHLKVCACIMLGNLARLDATCIECVQAIQIHKPLIDIVFHANSTQLLHAALGFLKNLAIPIQNKNTLGEAGLLEALSRIWSMDTIPQVQFVSTSLGRLLTVGSLENVRRITQDCSNTESGILVSPLVKLFENTEDEPIKMEIARLSTSICRVLYFNSTQSRGQIEPIRIKFLQKNPNIGLQLGFVVSQTKWPAVRSEGWFVFALMARSPEGAEIVSQVVSDPSVFQPLVELLTGDPSSGIVPASPTAKILNSELIDCQELVPKPVRPQDQVDELSRADRENALVLIGEMLKNHGSHMAVPCKTTFKDLLNSGGDYLLSHQHGRTETRSA
ncbi:GTP binding protein [Blumeria hordei DH14]|uniref:GTP binding protein n=1 Tax=Blumeria graminis f. sp. hordei (strain DH14) TaxID=546991 RepID=N1J565_BLUG1|nr:GTP binding protein [Blumeria hordei DH14]